MELIILGKSTFWGFNYYHRELFKYYDFEGFHCIVINKKLVSKKKIVKDPITGKIENKEFNNLFKDYNNKKYSFIIIFAILVFFILLWFNTTIFTIIDICIIEGFIFYHIYKFENE
jgi:hypothetical protein